MTELGDYIYVSEDGKHFELIFLNGLNNRYNYGGRMLFVDSCDDLYIANKSIFTRVNWKIFCKF